MVIIKKRAPWKMPDIHPIEYSNPNQFAVFESDGYSFLDNKTDRVIHMNTRIPAAHTIWSKDFYSKAYFSSSGVRAQRLRRIQDAAKKTKLSVTSIASTIQVFRHEIELGKYRIDQKVFNKKITYYEGIALFQFKNKVDFLSECEKHFGFTVSFISYVTVLVGSDTPDFQIPVGRTLLGRNIYEDKKFKPVHIVNI